MTPPQRHIGRTHRTAPTLVGALGLSLAAAPFLADGATLWSAPVTDADYRPVNEEAARLGQLLFYDPILSGNREVACATCHHPAFGTGDGLSLSLGDGGLGLGPDRVADPDNPPLQRVPRNAQSLFNLGAREFTVLFHDGRIEVDASQPYGLRTPLDADMVDSFESLLSAQSMFPVLSADEMAGHFAENEISRAVRMGLLTGPGGAWDLIARRVAAIPAYADAFIATYPQIAGPDDITFADISNAIASFIELEWRSDTAPFDAVLRGDDTFPDAALRGAQLFYGEAGCAACHSGPFLTDHAFHATGQVQLGPGKAMAFETNARDEGRYRVTGDPADLYAFRTPSLRNIALTSPYGHAGAYRDLAAFLLAHADPSRAQRDYDRAQAILPDLPYNDWVVLSTVADVEAIAAHADEAVALSPGDIADLLAFLDTLTDPAATEGRLGVPATVPSGLAVQRPAE